MKLFNSVGTWWNNRTDAQRAFTILFSGVFLAPWVKLYFNQTPVLYGGQQAFFVIFCIAVLALTFYYFIRNA